MYQFGRVPRVTPGSAEDWVFLANKMFTKHLLYAKVIFENRVRYFIRERNCLLFSLFLGFSNISSLSNICPPTFQLILPGICPLTAPLIFLYLSSLTFFCEYCKCRHRHYITVMACTGHFPPRKKGLVYLLSTSLPYNVQHWDIV